MISDAEQRLVAVLEKWVKEEIERLAGGRTRVEMGPAGRDAPCSVISGSASVGFASLEAAARALFDEAHQLWCGMAGGSQDEIVWYSQPELLCSDGLNRVWKYYARCGFLRHRPIVVAGTG